MDAAGHGTIGLKGSLGATAAEAVGRAVGDDSDSLSIHAFLAF